MKIVETSLVILLGVFVGAYINNPTIMGMGMEIMLLFLVISILSLLYFSRSTIPIEENRLADRFLFFCTIILIIYHLYPVAQFIPKPIAYIKLLLKPQSAFAFFLMIYFFSKIIRFQNDKRKKRFLTFTGSYSILVFLFFAFLSFTINYALNPTKFEGIPPLYRSNIYFPVLLSCVSLYFLIVYSIDNYERLEKALKCLMLCSIIMVAAVKLTNILYIPSIDLASYAQQAVDSDYVDIRGIVNISGTYLWRETFLGLNANTYALLLVYGIVLTIYFLSRSKSKVSFWLLIGMVFLFFSSLLATASRAGVIVSLCGILTYVMLCKYGKISKKFLIVIVIVIITLSFIDSGLHSEYLIDRFKLTRADEGRLCFALAALREFSQEPFWGSGGIRTGVFPSIRTGNHSDLINYLGQYGIIAFLAFLYFQFFLAKRVFKLIRTELFKLKEMRNLIALFSSFFVITFAYHIVSPTWYIFWIIMGLINSFIVVSEKLLSQHRC